MTNADPVADAPTEDDSETIAHALIVDTDAAFTKAVEKLLKQTGHDVVVTDALDQARSSLEDNQFSVAFIDVNFADNGGFELIADLTNRSPETRIVAMCPYADSKNGAKALKKGAYDLLTKPVADPVLVTKIADRAIAGYKLMQDQKELARSMKAAERQSAQLGRFFRSLNIRDGITGLYNHRYINELLRQEIQRARRYKRDLSIVQFDIDEFSIYNDTYGHEQGDVLLRQIGKLIGQNVRSADAVARWNAGSFMVMAPESSHADADRLAKKLLARVAKERFQGAESQPEKRITLSAGIASLYKQGEIKKMIAHVQATLQYAKDNGKNQVCAQVAAESG